MAIGAWRCIASALIAGRRATNITNITNTNKKCPATRTGHLYLNPEGWPQPTIAMSNVEKDLTKFKLQLGPEWQKLHTAKWRRPKWIKFPRSMLEDPRWVRLSPQAAKAWMHILVIASEHDNLELPPPDLLVMRLRSIGNLYHISSASSVIHELIQCGFLLKTTPELQSYRIPEIQRRKKERDTSAREATQGFSLAPRTRRSRSSWANLIRIARGAIASNRGRTN